MTITQLLRSRDFRIFFALTSCVGNAAIWIMAWWEIVHTNPLAAIAVAGFAILNIGAAVCLYGVEKAEPLASAIGGNHERP